MKSLQDQFLASSGHPLTINGKEVCQMDRIPIRFGTIRVTFLNRQPSSAGLALKSKKGSIKLSDGKGVRLLHIWDDPGFSRQVEHQIECPDGELRVWNIFRTHHPNGTETVDSWTGNAGIVVQRVNANCRRYFCSPGRGDFDPTDMIVEVDWTEE